jgi:hypothetical protein
VSALVRNMFCDTVPQAVTNCQSVCLQQNLATCNTVTACDTELASGDRDAPLSPRGGGNAPPRHKKHPFKLWPDDEPQCRTRSPGCLQSLDGELHYLPPPEERAKLAFFWLFFQATTPHTVEPPTIAQLRNLPRIVALARGMPLWEADAEVKHALRDLLHQASPPLPHDPSVLAAARGWYEKLSRVCADL